MSVAIAKATVGNATTAHLALVELHDNNKFSTYGISCGSRIKNAHVFVSKVLTRTVDMETEKYSVLYPEALANLATTDIVCEKCYKAVS